MLNKRIINTGGGAGACTTDTTQILNAGSTQSLALYRFEDNVNDTASGTGKFGKGAVFNGSNSEITLPAALSDGSTTDTNCISFWFNVGAEVTSSSSGNEIMSFSKSGSNTGKIALGSTTGNFSNETFSVTSDVANQYTYITETIPAGWNHAVVQWNSSTTKWDIYLNGQAKSTSTFGTNEQGKLLLKFGNRSSYYFDGKLDQVRIFNKSLSASEVTTLYNETSSTVNTLQILGDTSCIATYTFEGNAQDLSGNYYHGSASNIIYDYSGTASNVTYTTGKFDKAAVFNGTNSYISADNPNAAGGARSFSAWIKTTSTSFQSIITNGGTSHASGLNMFVFNNKLFSTSGNGSSAENYGPTSSANINTGAWVHCVLTMSGTAIGSILKTYVNGVLDGTHTTTVSITDTYNTFRIGGRTLSGSNTTLFNGEIDQVRIFNKELNSGEVNSLYNETTTTAALATINNPSTIAYYKMADGTDETGNYNGTTTNVDFNVIGKYGFAGLFNGSNSYIDISTLDFPTNDFSVSAWVYLNSTPGSTTYNMILTTAKQNSGGYFYFTFYGTQLQYYHVASGTSVIGGTAVAGQWSHVVLTQSSTSGAKIYLNNSVAASNTSLTANNTPNTTSGGVNTLGYYNTGSSTTGSLNGKLDQVRIFNKAISASEVTTLYNEIQCANTITAPEDYFNTKLYTGTGSSSNTDFTGVGFDPNFIWIKNRSSSGENHAAVDTVRGQGAILYPNLSLAQSGANYITPITDGFRINTGNNNILNNNYVSWNWKAGSSNVTNNEGTLTSTVCASPETGFSIVRYTGTSNYSDTLGHGLTKTPRLILQKAISNVSNWYPLIDLTENGTWDWAKLDTNQAFSPDNPTRFSANSKTINNWGWTGYDMINYCFHDVPGYQRIGTYTGNGETTGPYIYTGFEPAWIMIKRTDAAGAYNIFDNKRNSTNPRNSILQANVSDLEYTNTNYNFNFYDNGFQALNSNNDWNASGGSYMFIAIAANPDTSAPSKANSFNTLLYTGNDSNDRDITGLGFKPDFLWIKRRGSEPHALYDSVRGPNLQLTTHSTDAEATNSGSYLGMSSFDADGFNVGNNGGTNRAPHNYVAWAWKGLDHDRNLASINNDGSIPSSVSANIAAGFSIVSYAGNGTSGATVGHGLGGELDFLIVKSTNLTQAWNVYVKGVTTTNAQYLRLNEANNIYSTANPRFIVGNFSDKVFSIGSDNATNGNNDKYIAYCFRSISGYSKVGTYTGSGVSGKTVTTGFEPSWVMIKNVTTTGLSWAIFDNKRSTANPRNLVLWPDVTNGEYTQTNGLNFNSTGFEVINATNWLNKSGDTLIYMAFK